MKKIKRFFNYLKYFLLSKYGFVIIFMAFFVWVLFFDKNSIIAQRQLAKVNAGVRKEIDESKKMIIEKQSQINALTDSLKVIEKYAREYYQMQGENEDVFLFEK